MSKTNQPEKPLVDRIKNLISQQTDVGIVDGYFSPGSEDPAVHYVGIGPNAEFICQVNPKRDPANRALLKTGKKGCFLCEENMPDEEEGIWLDKFWKLYPNPRPYEKNHTVMVLTKNETNHHFQIIDNKKKVVRALDTIWQIGYEENRTDFNLTFNSINAGSSSRHFHYQIFECHLPILNYPIDFVDKDNVSIGIVEDYPAAVMVIEGADKKAVCEKVWYAIDKLNSYWMDFIPYVLSFTVINDKIRVYIFPRAAERPSDADSNLINTVFGICEMSGMLIVYSDEMAKTISLDKFRESLKVTSKFHIVS